MAHKTFTSRAAPIALLLGATIGLTACGDAYQAWRGPAGDQIVTSDFGNATMNNHLVQTCQAGPNAEAGKYVSASGCGGRTWDGEYANETYQQYVNDAAPQPNITRPIFRSSGL